MTTHPEHPLGEDAKVYPFPVRDTTQPAKSAGDTPDHTVDDTETPGQEMPASAGQDQDSDTPEAVPADSAAGSVSVDQPTPPGVSSSRRESRRPVLPAWLSSTTEFQSAARWVLGYAGHAAAFHAVRCPVYLARLVIRIPHGTLRLGSAVARWVSDAEGRPVRSAVVAQADAREYLSLSRQRDGRVRARSFLLAAATTAATAVVVAGHAVLPAAAQWAAATLAAAGLGWLGAPADQPLIGRAMVVTKVAKLTSDIVIKALGSLGIGEINKALGKGGSGIGFPKPITRDGLGWRADVDLPHGVTVTDILDRREKLASGLRRPLGCVWPESDGSEHAGRLVLWVGDQPLAQTKPRSWPLAYRGQASLFEPIPFGTDQRGRPVSIVLMFANLLIGAMPRYGKTFALRLVLLAAALDPTAELRIFELKGTGDLSALEKVAHHYASGIGDPALGTALNSLRELATELERRSETIAKLPKQVCPENKVTPELAARRDLGLHPVVAAIDECQNLFEHPEFGKEAGKLAEKIIKVGPAMGIMLVLATQRPDADSLPTGVSANVGIRFCLRVMGQPENDMVLGTSAYRNGIRATMFTARDKGVGILVGNADEHQIARADYVDGPGAERITDRARTLREAAGTLSGHALGENTTTERQQVDTVLDDLVAVLGPDETKVWTDTAVTRLAGTWPEVYGTWDAERLSAALKPHGVKTNRQVWGADEHGDGRNRRGFHRADLTDAITSRNQKHDGG